MKINLKDTTFVFVIRLDSIERLENLLIVIFNINKYFDTNIAIIEGANHNNSILASLLPKKVSYTFVNDMDNVFHRTVYYNRLARENNTPIIAIWDSDTIIDKKSIMDAVNILRSSQADIAYPYNGIVYQTSDILRRYYLNTKDIKVLYKNLNKLDFLYNQPMYGGAVFVHRNKYIDAGMENERHYGWGNEDYDRYNRFKNLGYKIYRVDAPLFHLCHPRKENSSFRSKIFHQISSNELYRISNSSKEELQNYIKSFKYE